MMQRSMTVAALGVLAVGVACAQDEPAKRTPLPEGAHYVEREFYMKIPGSEPQGVDALEVYVQTPGKHPLALLTHGTAATAEERMQVTAWAQLPQALWFAERGYVALVIVRRGYGHSGGLQDGRMGGCRMDGNFDEAGQASADDLRATVDYAAKNMPEVDASTIVSAGVSTGGFAQVALTANAPAGLKTAISFAGGRGGDGKGDLCNETGIVESFKDFGKKSRTPMLWIYAENDKWFPPKYAMKFRDAFNKAGGEEQFVMAPPDGEDGHHLYAHIAAWSSTVEKFLAEKQLMFVTPAYEAPKPPDVAAPPGLTERQSAVFKNFLVLGPNKAFAVSGGFYGYSVGSITQEIADQHAMENCEKARKGQGAKCEIVSRGK